MLISAVELVTSSNQRRDYRPLLQFQQNIVHQHIFRTHLRPIYSSLRLKSTPPDIRS